MKVLRVTVLMLFGLLLTVPVSRGAESDKSEAKTEDQAGSEKIKADIQKNADPATGNEADETPASSADAETDTQNDPATQSDIQGLRSDLETLRDQFQRNFDRNTAVTSRSLKFGGTVQTRFTQTDNGSSTNSFSVNSIILKFGGSLRKDYDEGRNVDYLFSINTNSDFTIRPQDAYLSYSIFPSLNLDRPYLYAYIGQQKKPFSLEASTTEEYKPTIKSAQFVNSLNLDERDIGLQIWGDLFPHVDYGFNYRVPAFQYSVAVINGSGPNRTDDNNAKDVVGRVVFNAPVDYNEFFRGLSLGFSGYWGTKKATATSTSTTSITVPTLPSGSTSITTKTTTTQLSRSGAKTRWGADLSYVNTPVGFTLEFCRGEDGTLSNETIVNGRTTLASKFRTVESIGYTFTLFYNFGEQFVKQFKNQTRYDDWYPLTYQPFFRFDRFDPDLRQGGDRSDIYTIGFNWFFAPTTKLQLNYNIKSGQIPSTQKSNEFLAQFQYGF